MADGGAVTGLGGEVSRSHATLSSTRAALSLLPREQHSHSPPCCRLFGVRCALSPVGVLGHG